MKEATQQKPKLQRRIRPSTIVYWFRLALGAMIGVVLMALEIKGSMGIILMVVVYIISYLVVRHGLRYGETELKGKHKAATLGIGTYIFTWAVVWILLYTLYPY